MYFTAQELDRSLDQLCHPLMSAAACHEAGGSSSASVSQSMGQAAARGVRSSAPGVSAAPQSCPILALTLHGVAGSLAWEETGLSFFTSARA